VHLALHVFDVARIDGRSLYFYEHAPHQAQARAAVLLRPSDYLRYQFYGILALACSSV
jgi:hypothetical protein